MTMDTGREMTNPDGGLVPMKREDTEPRPLIITPRYVAQQQQSLALMQRMVHDVLVDGRDYGRVPGIAGKMLFDNGAQLIIGAFNCYVGHRRILNLVTDNDKISVLVEAPIMDYQTGREVASGIGAASVAEPKNKYRWVEAPGQWGYDEESIKTLKSEERGGRRMYQIENPEPGELLNVIVKMASKRAEVDAAKNLPGVGSVLKELSGVQSKVTEDWDSFWGEIKRLNLKPDEIPDILGTKSIKDWQKLDRGNTLERAKGLCQFFATNKGKPKKTEAQIAKDKADLFDAATPIKEAAKPPASGSSSTVAGPSSSPSPATPAPLATGPEAAPKDGEAQFNAINEDTKPEPAAIVMPSFDEIKKFWSDVKKLYPVGGDNAVEQALSSNLLQYLQAGGTIQGAMEKVKAAAK